MIKKAILSFVRRISGAERNFQRLSQLEDKLSMLSDVVENISSTQEKKNEEFTEVFEKAAARIQQELGELLSLLDCLQNKQQFEKIISQLDSLLVFAKANNVYLKNAEEQQKILQHIHELCVQSIYNVISINSVSEDKKKLLYIPGGTQKSYTFSVIDEKLAFLCEANMQKNQLSPIFIVSNMKSGTYLLGSILVELGFQDINIHASDNVFTDHNNHTVEQQLDCDIEYLVGLPFELQVQCISKGQFLLGHISFRYAPLLEGKRLFCCARDLRFVCVSALRFNQRRKFFSEASWFLKGTTEEALFLFLTDEPNASALVYFARNILQWIEKFPESLIRYENLIDEAASFHTETLEKIASFTGKNMQEVVAARKRALGRKTHSYSGMPSKLEVLWSDRVEEKFKELGLDEINAALGYPRDWTPENYPSVK